MKFLIFKFYVFIICIVCIGCMNSEDSPNIPIPNNISWHVTNATFVDSCSADFAVGFSLYSKDNYIYIAYYDQNHQLSLAKKYPSGLLEYSKLPEFVDWDNHKSISLIIDNDGYLHLCANMHASPLVYYKSDNPLDINSLRKQPMLGINESKCTYPTFTSEANRLIFHYRDGGSGNGKEIFNEYIYNTKSWKRLLDKPLFDGEGKCNAYMIGPKIGPDGKYHILYCWRDTPDCSTNHGLYYAVSNDLSTWFNIQGESMQIPIKPENNIFLVDDVPVGGGLLNIGFQLGFSSQEQKPVIAYHKYDNYNHTNIFIGSINDNLNWQFKQLTNWDWKWDFKGTGAIVTELYISDCWMDKSEYHCIYKRLNSPYMLISSNPFNEFTETEYHFYPDYFDTVSSSIPNMIVQIINDSRTEIDMKTKLLLRYETQNTNHDIKPSIEVPASALMLYEISR